MRAIDALTYLYGVDGRINTRETMHGSDLITSGNGVKLLISEGVGRNSNFGQVRIELPDLIKQRSLNRADVTFTSQQQEVILREIKGLHARPEYFMLDEFDFALHGTLKIVRSAGFGSSADSLTLMLDESESFEIFPAFQVAIKKMKAAPVVESSQTKHSVRVLMKPQEMNDSLCLVSYFLGNTKFNFMIPLNEVPYKVSRDVTVQSLEDVVRNIALNPKRMGTGHSPKPTVIKGRVEHLRYIANQAAKQLGREPVESAVLLPILEHYKQLAAKAQEERNDTHGKIPATFVLAEEFNEDDLPNSW